MIAKAKNDARKQTVLSQKDKNKATRISRIMLKDIRKRNRIDYETSFRVRNGFHVKEYVICAVSPIHFCCNWVSIKTKTGLDLFELYKYQKRALMNFKTKRFNVILKSRQLGLSVLLCAYALWLAMFHKDKQIHIISIKHTIARNMLRRIKTMYSELPPFLQMPIVNGKKGSYGTADEIEFANRSSITVSASSPDAARSKALDLLIIDEAAFMAHASEIWASAYSTLTTTGGSAIINSTPYGIGNLFHDLFTKAQTGRNSFHPDIIHWLEHPTKDFVWYMNESRNLGKMRTSQELDCEFISSGYNVFDLSIIKALEEAVNVDMEIAAINGTLKFIGHDHYNNPTGYIFKDPDENTNYVIGCDVSSGKARDYSTFSIMTEDGEEVACYKGKIAISELTDLLEKFGYMYNNATIAPEVNNVGNGVVQLLIERGYPNIYVMKESTRVQDPKSVKDTTYSENTIYGWLTTGITRNKMLTELDDDLTSDRIMLRNPFFCKEAYTFIYNSANKPIALGKDGGAKNDPLADFEGNTAFHDDSIMAVAIANMARKDMKQEYGSIIFPKAYYSR